MPIAGPVDDMMRVGSVRVVADRVAPGRRRPRRAAEIVVTDGAGRPIEAAHGAVAAAVQQDLGIPARVDIGERVSDCRRRTGIRGEVGGAGDSLGVTPQLVQTGLTVSR